MNGAPLLTNEASRSDEELLTNVVTTRRRRDHSAIISALSNLSIQYNFQAIAIALAFMDGPAHIYPASPADLSLLQSLVFAGAITGQLAMGYVGDLIGRRFAMVLTNTFTFLGAAGSAVSTVGSAEQVYAILMVCRFVLGVGVGGKYPLSATISAEARDGDTHSQRHSATKVALAFFWQTPGAILPYVVALAVLRIFGPAATDAATVNAQFRIILGLGAVPALAVGVLCFFQEESAEFTQACAVPEHPPWTLACAAPKHPPWTLA